SKSICCARRPAGIIILAGVILLLRLPSTASGQIYVSKLGNAVGEYTLTGTTINPSLITGELSYDLAVSDGKLYVVTGNTTGAHLGAYDAATGAAINPSLISLPYTGVGEYSLAVSGSDLFVA